MIRLRVPKDERNHNVNFGYVIEDLQDCERYIAELEQMVRKLLQAGDCVHDSKHCYASCPWIRERQLAFALLKPEAGKEVGR